MKVFIKRVLKSGVNLLGSILHLIFPYSLSSKLTMFRVKLYSSWLSKEFKAFGETATICSPLNLVGGKYIDIGENVLIGKNGILTAWDQYGEQTFSPSIIIGNDVSIGEDCHITAINNITIGDKVLIGKKVTLSDNSHGRTDGDGLDLPPVIRNLYSKGPVIIEDGVWIGDKVTVVANVRLGKNSIIGANSLVTKDIPPNCVAGGVPARVIKEMI